MEEITLAYLEEHFEEVMNRLEYEDQGFLVRIPNGEAIMLVPEKNEVIQKMENEGLIEEYKNFKC